MPPHIVKGYPEGYPHDFGVFFTFRADFAWSEGPAYLADDEGSEIGVRPRRNLIVKAIESAAASRAGISPSRSIPPPAHSDEMIALYQKWIDSFPIASIEDGLAENDWAGFAHQTAKQGERIQIVCDDNFVTNPTFIRHGIKEKTANAALIKLNQIGAVTETIEAIALCRKAGWNYVVSHRSRIRS